MNPRPTHWGSSPDDFAHAGMTFGTEGTWADVMREQELRGVPHVHDDERPFAPSPEPNPFRREPEPNADTDQSSPPSRVRRGYVPGAEDAR